MLWNAWCCTLIATGQVMHRLKLTWYSDRGEISQTASTFRIVFWISVTFIALRSIINWSIISLSVADAHQASSSSSSPYYSNGEPAYGAAGDNEGTVAALNVLNHLVSLVYVVYFVYIIAKTRNHIRHKYSIPQQYCAGEDCCCAFWCTCCTVAQMARHTADYETYAARCCSETGMAPNAPSIA